MKIIIRVESDSWIVRDKFEPILKDKKTVTVSRDSKPGLLTGIDKPYYEPAYPETAVVYGIYPLNKKPDIGKLKPMKQLSPSSRESESYKLFPASIYHHEASQKK